MATSNEELAELPKFPTPFVLVDYQDTGFPMRTLLEVKLDGLTHSIRTKPQWWRKVHDEDIVSKGRAEAAEQSIPEELFEFAISVRHDDSTYHSKCCDGAAASPIHVQSASIAMYAGACMRCAGLASNQDACTLTFECVDVRFGPFPRASPRTRTPYSRNRIKELFILV